MYKMQIPQLHQDVEVVSGPGHRRQGLEAPEDTLLYLVTLRDGQLVNKLFAGPELLEEPLDLVVPAKQVEGAGAQDLKFIGVLLHYTQQHVYRVIVAEQMTHIEATVDL